MTLNFERLEESHVITGAHVTTGAHDCTCEDHLTKLFKAFGEVNRLRLGMRVSTTLDGIVQGCIDRANRDCVFSLLGDRLMKAWLAREPNHRKLYVGFLRKRDATIKVKPFIRVETSVVNPYTPYQESQMYQWLATNSNGLLCYLKKAESDLSWKWEKRGFNKLILRLKPLS